MNGFVAVHVGAGQHSDFLWPTYKNACKSACQAALELLRKGRDSTEAVAAAVAELEDCPITNAGLGSSLSIERTVECDAAIMDGSSLNFGSVGAMGSVKNPVEVARKIAELQTLGLSYNRIPPCTLVGEGATLFAEAHGFDVKANLKTYAADAKFVKFYNLLKKHQAKEEKIAYKTTRAIVQENLAERFASDLTKKLEKVVQEEAATEGATNRKFKDYNSVVQEYDSDRVSVPLTPSPELADNGENSVELISPPLKKLRASKVETFNEDAHMDDEWLRESPEPSGTSLLVTEGQEWPPQLEIPQRSPECILLDTVGAVCVDSCGNVSSAVSSGGIILKHSGRIGQAAVYGAGCWAQNSSTPSKPSIGCSVTGVGEYLMKTMFAKECYQAMYERDNCITTLPDVLKERFIESPFLRLATSTKLAGVLLVQHYPEDNRCELGWAHNTKTMILGYGSTSSKKTSEIVSVMPETAVVGQSVAGGFECVRLTSQEPDGE